MPENLSQRLPLEKLQAWEAAGLGMFIHFGMSTFLGIECPDGQADLSAYSPDSIDADGWVRLAKDAGMKYIVLTAKHVSGHCLWPSKHTDYHVGDKTDVVAACAEACAKHGLGLGFYYCSWDNHHRFGSVTPTDRTETGTQVGIFGAHASRDYIEFQLRQLEELLNQYGPIFEVWIDIPQVLGADGRRACYDLCASVQPGTVILMNQGFQGGSELDIDHAWPLDASTREKQFPECTRWGQGSNGMTIGHSRVYEIESKHYYIPTEICDTLGYYWFHDKRDLARKPEEIAAMRSLARSRSCNLLLNVPPDRTGRIPTEFAETLRVASELALSPPWPRGQD